MQSTLPAAAEKQKMQRNTLSPTSCPSLWPKSTPCSPHREMATRSWPPRLGRSVPTTQSGEELPAGLGLGIGVPRDTTCRPAATRITLKQ